MLTWAEYLDWVQYFTERDEHATRAQARARGEIRTDDPEAVQALLKASGAAARKPPKTLKAAGQAKPPKTIGPNAAQPHG
jgi:hypothetical protein